MITDFKTTHVYQRIRKQWDANRYIIAYGGSSSSKSISILQMLTLYAYRNKNKRVTLSAESLPVIKKTLFVDWKDIVMQGLFDVRSFNKTEMVYTFPTGTVFNFVPADDQTRWHGMRQDIVYFDEVFHIKKDIYQQADIRTKDKVLSSFNPAAMFWIADTFNDADTYVDHSTYHDNPYITKPIIDALEKRIKIDENFYNVYVLGKWGSLEGLVFQEGKHWQVCDKLPDECKKEILGLDFGYSVDPAALVHIQYYDGELWLKELLYKHEQTNNMIAEYINGDTVADSAEPKSIAELRMLDKNVYASVKGKDSINNGIQLMKQFKINITSDSLNLIKEFRNYKWDENRQGETLTKPVDNWNHCIDATRYGVTHLFARPKSFTLV